MRQLDDFLVGANLPWIRYGGDFGANAWSPEGGVARAEHFSRARDLLFATADAGARVVRWFLLCDGRAGVRFDPSGNVEGLDNHVLRDLDAAVDLLEASGLSAIFVLFDFTWFARRRVIDGVQTGGQTRIVADEGRRASLLDRVIAPILEHCGDRPQVLAWDILNEPDWILTRLPRPRRRIRLAALRALVGDVARLVHDHTRQMATVGSARPAALPGLSGLGLDFYQVHWYDKPRCRFPLERGVAALRADRPVLLGEFPTRPGSPTVQSIVQAARRGGFAGALAWSMTAADDATDRAALEAGLRGLIV